MDWLRIEVKLKVCLLKIRKLKKESLAKDKRVVELVGAVAMEKLLQGNVTRDCLRMQLAKAQADVSAYKLQLRQSHHELQLAESNLMVECSASFYSGFDTLVEATKDRFPGAKLSSLKA